MKTTMKKLILTAIAAAAIATAAQAQADTITAAHGHALTIGGEPDEVATPPAPTYIWYRNGIVIPGATGATYTVPESLANGLNQRFQRQARLGGDCTGDFGNLSNPVIVHFKCGGGHGTVVTNTSTPSDLCWADRNVNTPGTFMGTATNTTAGRGDVYSPFYQWNRMAAWPATGAGTPEGWNPQSDDGSTGSATWTFNPCPEGWRLPTSEEFQALVTTSGGVYVISIFFSGGTWLVAGAKGNAVPGMMFGHRHSACGFNTGQDMHQCIFLPAVGHRTTAGAQTHQDRVGYYWASAQSTATTGRRMVFCQPGGVNNLGTCANLLLGANWIYASNAPAGESNKLDGLSVRCVQ